MVLARWAFAVALAATALSLFGACAASPSPDLRAVDEARTRPQPDAGARARAIDSALAVATFDSAWRTVGRSLEGRGVTRIDWAAVRRELAPRAAQAQSDVELRSVIDDMLRRLGESHFAILPAPPSPHADSVSRDGGTLGSAGVAVRLIDRDLVVWRVDSTGAARHAGVVPGWRVERIDAFTPPALGAADSVGLKRLGVLTGALGALRGPVGSRVHLVMRDPAGRRHDVTFARDTLRGPLARFGNLPPLPASLQFERRLLGDGRCVGLIRFEYWMPPVMPALDRAVDASRGCAGIVLDLRGNLGGVAAMMMGVAGHFVNEPKTLGTMRTRGEEMRFAANPRRVSAAGAPVEPFGGPLAIVIDGLSASTSEMFAAGLQALGRARVFGERSAGQALPAIATRLPTGDVLMHVVADFVAADGSRIEGRGAVPDEAIPLLAADVLAERDAPLAAALGWIERARPVRP